MEVVLLPFSIKNFLNILEALRNSELLNFYRFVDVVLNERDELALTFGFSVL